MGVGPMAIATPIYGIGDSLMCGLQGYDVEPEISFFKHLCDISGQHDEPVRISWNMGRFNQVCSKPAEHPEVRQALEQLSNNTVKIQYRGASTLPRIFAAPGFTLQAFQWFSEKSSNFPAHLKMLAKPFINPDDALSMSPQQRLVEQAPAKTYVIWLGGVEWISCILGRQQLCHVLPRIMLRRYRAILKKIVDRHHSVGADDPLFLVGGMIDPTLLPLFAPAVGEIRRTAFADEQQPPENELLSLENQQAISKNVAILNSKLKVLVERHGGKFVDLNHFYAQAKEKGYVQLADVRVPFSALIGADLVHPTPCGHALIADYFMQAAGGAQDWTHIFDIERLMAEDQAHLNQLDAATCRIVLKQIYRNFIYAS